MKVPNEKPSSSSRPYKIAVIGEAPGFNEDAYGRPFIGPSGKLLGAILQKLQVDRASLFIGNVCQVRPPNDDISKFDWYGEEIQAGIEQLKEDLASNEYNLIILLGGTALQAAGVSIGITSYRGTVFICTDLISPFYGKKCIGTYHPAFILRGNSHVMPIFEADFRRALDESKTTTLEKTERTYELDLTALEICDRLRRLRCEGEAVEVGFDIEGYIHALTCYSVSSASGTAFIVPFTKGGNSAWTEDEEKMIWIETSRFMSDPRVGKILQNSLYDLFVLLYSYKIIVINVTWDIMLSQWEMYPEFEKSLGFQVSFYTKEPYYKSERKATTDREHWAYCCKDSDLTREIKAIHQGRMSSMDERCREHFLFNMAMLRPLLYMEMKGIRYNSLGAGTKSLRLANEIINIQKEVNDAAGRDLNVKSTPMMRQFVYGDGPKDLNLPKRFSRPKKGKERAVTCDEETLRSLAKATGKKVLLDIISIRNRRTRIQMLNIRADEDGRIRCGYNVVGTNTGRLTCYTSPTGSGYNLTTIPEDDQDLYLADPGYLMWKCDLEGADAWTVAAWSASLGDPTMLDDMRYGIKPAKVLALAFTVGPQILSLPRAELKVLCDTIDKKSDLYFGAKCSSHASNYDGQAVTISATIFKESLGEINIESRIVKKLQEYYFMRYRGILRWHEYVRMQLRSKGYIHSACGALRRFYGDKNDSETFRAALSFEPQANTTFITNQATLNLWRDPENRDEKGQLIIKPAHEIHDALMGQFPDTRIDWSVSKIKSWFDITLTIANIPLVIPFEGGYGPDWKNTNTKI